MYKHKPSTTPLQIPTTYSEKITTIITKIVSINKIKLMYKLKLSTTSLHSQQYNI